jgi:hypothetical protein
MYRQSPSSSIYYNTCIKFRYLISLVIVEYMKSKKVSFEALPSSRPKVHSRHRYRHRPSQKSVSNAQAHAKLKHPPRI